MRPHFTSPDEAAAANPPPNSLSTCGLLPLIATASQFQPPVTNEDVGDIPSGNLQSDGGGASAPSVGINATEAVAKILDLSLLLSANNPSTGEAISQTLSTIESGPNSYIEGGGSDAVTGILESALGAPINVDSLGNTLTTSSTTAAASTTDSVEQYISVKHSHDKLIAAHKDLQEKYELLVIDYGEAKAQAELFRQQLFARDSIRLTLVDALERQATELKAARAALVTLRMEVATSAAAAASTATTPADTQQATLSQSPSHPPHGISTSFGHDPPRTPLAPPVQFTSSPSSHTPFSQEYAKLQSLSTAHERRIQNLQKYLRQMSRENHILRKLLSTAGSTSFDEIAASQNEAINSQGRSKDGTEYATGGHSADPPGNRGSRENAPSVLALDGVSVQLPPPEFWDLLKREWESLESENYAYRRKCSDSIESLEKALTLVKAVASPAQRSPSGVLPPMRTVSSNRMPSPLKNVIAAYTQSGLPNAGATQFSVNDC